VNADSNLQRSLKGLVLVSAVLFAGSALAASRGALELHEAANVAGKQLKSGTYTVQWEGSGDQVQLKIYQGKNEVASTQAKMVTLDKPQANDGTLMRRNDDGTMTVMRINFGGKKFAFEINGEGGSAGAVGAAR